MKLNSEWHKAHRMPASPTRLQRVRWHAEHSAACGCRPVPLDLADEVKALKRKAARTN